MTIKQSDVDEIIDFIHENLISIDSEKWFDLVKSKFPNAYDDLINEIVMVLSGGDVVEID